MCGGLKGSRWPTRRDVRMRDSNDNDRPAVRGPTLNAMLRASDGILDMLPIATFISDARGTILQYNKRAVEVWGRAPEPGQTHEEFNQTSSFAEVDGTPMPRSLLAEVLATGTPIRDAERMVVRPDGRQIY